MRDEKELPTHKPTYIASSRLPDGRLVELVYVKEIKRTALAVFHEGEVTIEESIEVNEHTTLLPIRATNDLIRHEALLLPEMAEPFSSVTDLAADIQAYLARYVSLSPEFLRIASHYVMLTWVYDAFNELPYLRFRGDYGSGKTRALTVVGSLCYKAFMAGGASTVSPIFHTLDTFQGTLVIDEADFRFSDATAEIVKILNNGNIRGFPVLRTMATSKGAFAPCAFSVFGPKIIAMRESFQDQALESRFLTEEMGQRALSHDIPLSLPDRQKEEAQILRNKLLMYRFQTLPHMKADDALVDRTLSPRLNQILVPLLSVIEDESLRQELRSTVRHLDGDLAAERAQSIEAYMLRILFTLMGQNPHRLGRIPVAEITEAFRNAYGSEIDRPITHRYVGEIIRKRLHLTTYKSHGVFVVPMSEKAKVDYLCTRYGISDKE